MTAAILLVLLLQFLAADVTPAAAQLLSPGQLAQPHVDVEGMSNCTKCHVLGSQVQPERCLACHETLAARVASGQGYHKDKTTGCVTCHTDHLGRDYQMVRWDRDTFDHAEAGYRLEGKHAEARCDQCHKTASYIGLPTDCASCHLDEHRGQLGPTCADCHTPAAWKPVTFEHSRARFALVGKHTRVECAGCHVTETAMAVMDSSRGAADSSFVRYRDIPFAACTDCHQDIHRGQFSGPPETRNQTQNRNAAPVTDCTTCHVETGWKPAAGFDHTRARFQLTGGHTRVLCDACHRRDDASVDTTTINTTSGGAGMQRFRPLAFGRCTDCHADSHRGQFPGRDCTDCHTDAAWKPARLDHDTSRFTLQGRHEPVPCDKCHHQEELGAGVVGARFRPVPFAACADCHADVHAGQFGVQDCGACHTVAGWKAAADFDHERSRFPLRGRHVQTACDKCHAGVAEGTPTRFRPLPHERCDDCHADSHDAQFVVQGRATDCAVCHQDSDWKPASAFDHDRASYHLEGAHTAVACAGCHPAYTTPAGEQRRRYRPLSTDCAACHR